MFLTAITVVALFRMKVPQNVEPDQVPERIDAGAGAELPR